MKMEKPEKSNTVVSRIKTFGIAALLLLLAGSCLFGYSFHKKNQQQSQKLKERETQLSEARASLTTASEAAVSLNEEVLSLKSALAVCSSYLSEDDLTDADKLPEISDNPSADPEETETQNTDSDSDNKPSNEKTAGGSSYQKKFPKLYVSEKDARQGKVVHLTFDDGPSQNTPKVLDILDKYDIKATFFVVYNDEEPACNYYKEIVDRGHTLAIHTASHNYKQIYASVDAYLEDFDKIYSYVYEKTGVRPTLFRYPGGSTNCLSYASGKAIMEEMKRRGFIYYDWNVSSGDGGNQATRSSIYDWVTSKAVHINESVVLMHDSGGKGETVAALPSIIETLQDAGCVFEPLTSSNKPVQFQQTKEKSN